MRWVWYVLGFVLAFDVLFLTVKICGTWWYDHHHHEG